MKYRNPLFQVDIILASLPWFLRRQIVNFHNRDSLCKLKIFRELEEEVRSDLNMWNLHRELILLQFPGFIALLAPSLLPAMFSSGDVVVMSGESGRHVYFLLDG